MDNLSTFKVPEHVPQDLLLIHNLVGEVLPTQKIAEEAPLDDSISSSDSETASEAEVEADLLSKPEDDDLLSKIAVPSDSNSDSDSDSDSELDDSSDRKAVGHSKPDDLDDDDDDEPGPVAKAGTYFQTKNEVPETQINIPDIEEVGSEEVLEKVGEIMSIIDRVVIVKGLPAKIADRASERALDSDTLLVFEDRRVLGYVYETFGPTHQPLYQIKFNHSYPLDPEKVQVSREVYHVPRCSKFVFLSQIKHFKGSDASNVHDEEPAEDELEFSDDEQEAAFKSSRKRQSRANSVASSRQPTPSPSHMRDQDMADEAFLGANPYDEHGPYDMDFAAGPSRPPPMPYDDPYADEFGTGPSAADAPSSRMQAIEQVEVPPFSRDSEFGLTRGRGRARGRGRGRERGDGRPARESGGRGRGRGRGRGGRRSSEDGEGWASRRQQTDPSEKYDPRIPRPLSPTSLAIARATGQYTNSSNFTNQNQTMLQSPMAPDTQDSWSYQHAYQNQIDHGPEYQQQYVQPHINPRFASAFGMNLGFMQSQLPYGQYGQYGVGSHGDQGSQAGSSWADQWTVPVARQGASHRENDGDRSDARAGDESTM